MFFCNDSVGVTIYAMHWRIQRRRRMAYIQIEVGVDSIQLVAELLQQWGTLLVPNGKVGDDDYPIEFADGKVILKVVSVDEETIRHLFGLTAGKPADLTQNIGNKGRRGTGRKGGRQAKQQTPPPAQPQGTVAQKEEQQK